MAGDKAVDHCTGHLAIHLVLTRSLLMAAAAKGAIEKGYRGKPVITLMYSFIYNIMTSRRGRLIGCHCTSKPPQWATIFHLAAPTRLATGASSLAIRASWDVEAGRSGATYRMGSSRMTNTLLIVEKQGTGVEVADCAKRRCTSEGLSRCTAEGLSRWRWASTNATEPK